MKKMILWLSGMLIALGAHAQTADNLDVTLTWPFSAGNAGQTAVISQPDFFSLDYVTIGSNLAYAGVKTVDGHTQTAVQPSTQASSSSDDNAVKFVIKTRTGITFTPTKVSFRTYRHGTDGGLLDISWESKGNKTALASGIVPMRNNLDLSKTPEAISYWEYSFDTAEPAGGESALAISLYSLGNTKQVSYSDICIEGKLNGTVAAIPTYTLSFRAEPEGAGTVSSFPVGQVMDENTSVTLSQQRSFGYRFVCWTDENGTELSRDEAYTFTLTANTQVVARYETIPTYELKVETTSGAADYMITYQPAPQMIGGKQMFEAATQVSLTATSNPILSFASWSNGETAATTSLTMDADRLMTANYNALDYIAGWDFHQSGNNGRKADFAAADNDADMLVLRNASGATTSWLDKSQTAAGGYEGRPSAVNWKDISEKYYYQTKINAEAFSDIHVQAEMLYNFIAYTVQKLEYSFDNLNWTEATRVTLGGAKNWTPIEADLPAECNHCKELYLRWIPDYTSPTAGSGTTNDGTSIANIFIYGVATPVDDGKAPVLLSTVPADGSSSASVSGRIVLNFDEKVKLAEGALATLDGKVLELNATGSTVTAEYKGLTYSENYHFVLPANSVSDLSDSLYTKEIAISFTTRSHPAVSKGSYDFIVPDDGTFRQALAAASARTDKNVRYRIFIRKGSYLIPADEGSVTGSDGKSYPSATTSVNTPNLSIIGEDMDQTELYNRHDNFKLIEGLNKANFISFGSAAKNMYVQDIAFKNGCHWDESGNGDGRCPALADEGDKNIFKNFKLVGWQDSYLSNNQNARYYFETSELHGAVDYMCGKGDVFYQQCKLVIERNAVPLCAPSQARKYGYVYVDCEVSSASPGHYKDFTLGRPWGSGTPGAIFINLTVGPTVNLSAEGWSEMSGGYPMRFAEYGTKTATGTFLDLSQRKKVFGDSHANNPVLSAEEAADYSIAKVMGGDDDWDPTYFTEQAQAPEISYADGSLTWQDSPYAFLYAIVKNGSVIAFTQNSSYAVTPVEGDVYGIRAANEMGGLGTISNLLSFNADGEAVSLLETLSEPAVVSVQVYSPDGRRLSQPAQGLNLIISRMADGSVRCEKMLMK